MERRGPPRGRVVDVVTRTSTGRRGRIAVGTVEPTRRLVAHLPGAAATGGFGYGPQDGEPVDVPAPCVRVKAGYWCPCGASFIGTATWEITHFARVVPLGRGTPSRYVDDRDGGYEAPVPLTTAEERAALLAQIEALPVGTVVERHGTGIARRFGDSNPPDAAEPGRRPAC